jgi:hypothetical protein
MDGTTETVVDARHDRVRALTKPEINQRIDEEMVRFLQLYANADRQSMARRLEELDQEWDMERVLEANAAAVVLAGLVLGKVVNRFWYLLSAVSSGFLMVHASKGWCPPVPFWRRRGVRTRKEIERERYAIKLLRGDFDAFHSGEKPDINRLLQMVDTA